MPKNSKNMNALFRRPTVEASEPDSFWPLRNELVGVEIEVEDLEGSTSAVSPEWTVHPDQSLRNGTEFVTSGPMSGRRLSQAIDKFFDAGFHYNMSPRTSVHIHVNASDNMSVDQFRNLFAIMYLVEPAVFRWADENRKWCGYCSPLTDLDPYRIACIMNENSSDAAFVASIKGQANSDRYYGLNVAAYAKHGTVEFRYFPCTNSRDALKSWIKFVLYVKKAAMEFEDPVALLNAINTRADAQRFIAGYFGEVAGSISGNLDFDDCVSRVRELRGIVCVEPDAVRAGEGYKSQRSKGFTKFLARTFPTTVPEDSSNPLEEASKQYASASEEYRRVMSSRVFKSAEAMAALSSINEAQAKILRLNAVAKKPAKPAPRGSKPGPFELSW